MKIGQRIILTVFFGITLFISSSETSAKGKNRPKKLYGHANVYRSSASSLYAKRLTKNSLNQRFNAHEIPLGWVKKGVSKKSLAALRRFMKYAEQHQMLLIYPNTAGTAKGEFAAGEEGNQVANGMTGDRAKTDLEFTTTFDINGTPNVKLEWPSPARYMAQNEYTIKDGFHKTEVTDIRKQYEYIVKNPQVRKAFEEIVKAEVHDMVARDSSYQQKFEDQKGQFYFNIIQYFGDYQTLPAPLKTQITRYSEEGQLSLEKIVEASKQKWSNGGGWHSDGVDLLLKPNENLEHTMQSLVVIDSSGIIRGGGTAVRNEPRNWKTPFSKLKEHEKLVLRVKGPDGAIATFSQYSRNPSTGESIKTSHMAEPYWMRAGGSRTALSLFVYLDEPSKLPVSIAGSNQGPQEERSLILPH